MRIYVDQLDCTGAGQCEQLAPDVFALLDDGLATVRDADGEPMADGGAPSGAVVDASRTARVLDAIDVCPGACIRRLPD
ncbi:ferredoxin [Pseudonocardia xishanensis]|uniref:Ferredoxin n=1 Tax=Pseudonocardia xishanensis TaxID=630995 RepID=A0ABP8RT91_9PSEU